jgi:ABC-type multidrug transport system permease subunit
MKSSLVTYALGFIASAALMAGCSSSGGSSFGTPSGVTPSGFYSPRTISINSLLITAAHPDLGMRNHVGPVAPDKHHEKKGLYQVSVA